MSEGIVLKAGRGRYTVQTDTGRVLPCSLRGNLKKNLFYPESRNRRQSVQRVRKLQETDPVAVGDRVEVIPNHVCPTVNLMDELLIARDGQIVDAWKVAARGKVR